MKNYTRIARAKEMVISLGRQGQKIQSCCGGMTLAGCWVPTEPLHPSWAGEKTQRKARGTGQGQGETTQQLLSWAKQAPLGEINFNYCQLEV